MNDQDNDDGGIRAWAEQGAAEEALFDSLPPDVDTYADAAKTAGTTQIAEYNRTAAALAGLRGRLVGVVYDVTTTAGMTAAKKDRAEVRDLLVGIEKERVRIKAPALERCRLIDAEAKTITAELEALKKPIDEQIKAEERRREEEKQAKINAEFARVEAIQTAIHELHMEAVVTGKSAEFIAARLAQVQATALDPLVYQEQMPQAQLARQQVLEKLSTSLMAAKFAEAEAAKLEADRAELAELRRLAAEQKRKDEEAEAVRRAAAAAEQRAQAAALAEAQRNLDEANAELQAKLDKIAADEKAKADAELAAAKAAELAAQPQIAGPAQELSPEEAMAQIEAVFAEDFEYDLAKHAGVPEALQAAGAAAAPVPAEEATLKLGDLNASLGAGITMSEAFVCQTLGIPKADVPGRAVLFRPSQRNQILEALAEHCLKLRD